MCDQSSAFQRLSIQGIYHLTITLFTLPFPGFLPDFRTVPAIIEVRHPGSACTVVDTKLGRLEGRDGELGVHCVDGGQFAMEYGVQAAMRPIADFVS